jgi:hypothetical protein
MRKGTCQSDTSWTKQLDAQVSMNLYQRTATVAYSIANFSILSIESMGTPVDATTKDLVSDIQRMCKIMYPAVADLLKDAVGAITNPSTLFQDIQDWGSVYSIQMELFATMWILKNGFPTWAAGPRDILEAFLTIPVQFGTVLWQFADIKSLPPALSTTASSAQVSYRARAEPWTLTMFSVIAVSLVVWAIACLLFVQVRCYGKIMPQISPTIAAAFQSRNPFDGNTTNLWASLTGWIGRMRGKTPPTSQTTDGANAQREVVARTVSDNGTMIVVDQSRED